MTLIRFDDFEFDHAAYRLRRGGERIAVEPKVLEVLAVLIEHRDRVVPKQELLDTVWPDQYVTESVLTQAIYEIRKALSESSRDQGHVRTVHGRGYQFRGDVEVAGPDQTKRDQPTGASEAPSPIAAEHSTRRRRIALGFLLGALILIAGWLQFGQPELGVTAGILQFRQVPIAVLPIDAGTNDPEFSLLALSMTDLLTLRLQQHPALVLRATDYVIDPSFRYSSLEAFAAEAGATHVLTGSLQSGADDTHAVLTARLAEIVPDQPARSIPLGSFELPLLKDAIGTARFTQARDRIADRMVEVIQPALPNSRPAAGMTDDVEAYRLYLTGIQAMLANSCDGREAIDLIEQALERDPDFAYAWLRLSWAHYSQVWACGADAMHYQLALDAGKRALDADPSLLDAHYVGATILVETGRIEEAYRYVLEAPPVAFHGFSREYALRFAGFLTEAEKWMRVGLENDPLFFSTSMTGEAPNVLLYQNRLDEYLAMLSAGDSAYHRFYRGFAEFLRGNEEVAMEVLEPAFRENPGDLFGRFAHALMSTIEGDDQAARAIVQQIIEQRRSLDATDGEMTYKQAQLLALAGDSDRALQEFESAVDAGFVCVPYFAIDPALESIRSTPRFAEIYDRALQRHLAFGLEFGLSQYLPALSAS